MKYSSITLLIFCLFTTLGNKSTLAQIVPDRSLNIKTKVSEKNNSYSINGGTPVRQNLFHSFDEFNLNRGKSAVFKNSKNIKNIFSRVTGRKVSNINGSITVSNNANLFFFNSNGINLYKNARFESVGSITLSTAKYINFSESDRFSLTNISSDLPRKVGNSFDIDLLHSKPINIIGNQHNIRFNNSELPQFSSLSETRFTKVDLFSNSNKELNILGNSIKINGGVLNSPGSINIISANKGKYKFRNSIFIDNQTNKYPSNIDLTNKASIEVFGSPVNSILLSGDNINIFDNSILLSTNYSGKSLGSTEIFANKIFMNGIRSINQLGSVENLNNRLRKEASFSGIINQNFNGEGAEININTEKLKLTNFSSISTINDGNGKSGDLNIFSNNTFIDGTPPVSFTISSIVSNQVQGLSGDINITGDKLLICCGGQLNSQNFSFSPTQSLPGADINIRVNDLRVTGSTTFDTGDESIARNVRTGRVGSNIGSLTFFNGSGGNIFVNSQKTTLDESGTILANSSGIGKSGDINLNSDTTIVKGIPGVNSLELQSKILSSSIQVDPTIRELFQISSEEFSANSGKLVIDSKTIKLANNGVIGVSNEGQGDAGNLIVDSNFLHIINSSILANTNGGDGGSIQITSKFFKIDDGTISSSSSGAGLGGNIGVSSTVLATKGQTSIEANAENNFAGNVSIEAEQLIARGDTRFSASSQAGSKFDGQVNINQGQENLNLVQEISEPNHSVAAVTTQCTNKGEITNHGSGINPLNLSETQRKALDLKQRVELASQFTYLDHKTGERKPFKRWLGIQRKDDGNLEFVFSPEQSKTLQKMLSSLDNVCLIKS